MLSQFVKNSESGVVISPIYGDSEWTEEDKNCGYVSTEVDDDNFINLMQNDSIIYGLLTNKNNIQDQIQGLYHEINRLNEEIEALKSELNEQKVLELRDISFEQARKEIFEWLTSRENSWYYSDIVEELRIDLDLVIRVIEALNKDGIRIVEQE